MKQILQMLLLFIATTLYAKTTTQTASYTGGDEESKKAICQKAQIQAQVKAAQAITGIDLSSDIEISKGVLVKDSQIGKINAVVKVQKSSEKFAYPKCTVTITATVDKQKAKSFINAGSAEKDLDQAINDEQEEINRLNALIVKENKKQKKTKQLTSLKKKKQATIKKFKSLQKRRGSNNMKHNDRAYLYLTTNTPTEVYIDGKYRDTTPFKRLILKRHKTYRITYKAVDDEYFDSKKDSKIKLTSLKKTIKIALSRGSGTFDFVGDNGVTVFLNGNKVHTINDDSDASLEPVDANDYKIEIYNRDFTHKSTYQCNLVKDTVCEIDYEGAKTTRVSSRERKRVKKADVQSVFSGVWKDPDTGLIWQNEPYTVEEEKAYEGKYNHGKAGDWHYAKQYCRDLSYGGYSDWRLPNIDELKTLISQTKYKHTNGYSYSIKRALLGSLPDNPTKKWFSHWSSTTNARNSSNAWNVYFVSGGAYNVNKDNSNFVRCVR